MLSEFNKKCREHQRKLQILIGACGFMAVGYMAYSMFISKYNAPQKPKSVKSRVKTVSSQIDPNLAWREHNRLEMENMGKQIEQLQKSLNILVPMVGARKEEAKAEAKPSEIKPYPAKTASIGNIRREVMKAAEDTASGEFPSTENLQEEKPKAIAAIKEQPKKKGILVIEMGAGMGIHSSEKKTPDNYLAPATIIEGVMLSGIDASCAVSAPSNPEPIIIRLRSKGSLPRKFQSDLYDCRMIAEGYGDRSSQRVKIRVIKLVITNRKTGEITDFDIKGAVWGEDGRPGLRGTLVDTSMDSVRGAALAGFASSLGQAFGTNNNPVTFSPANMGLAQTNPITGGTLVREGVAKGIGSAFEKIADHMIKDADQTSPVVSVQAGRKVDVIIEEGVALDGSTKISKKKTPQKNMLENGENHE